MAINYLEVILITAATVSKVLLCCIAGMFISRYYSYGTRTEKGLTYLSVRVFTPLLLFSRLCETISWESMKLYYWGLIMAFFPIIVGVACAFFCRLFLNKTYLGMLILSCAFQNGLTFPVSLILNLKGISWFGPSEAEDGSALVFLYNIICAIGLWGVGEPVIRYFKGLELEDEKQKRKILRESELASKKGAPHMGFHVMMSEDGEEVVFPYSRSPTMPGMGPSIGKDSVSEAESSSFLIPTTPHASTKQQLMWYKPPTTDDEPLSVGDLDSTENENGSSGRKRGKGGNTGSISVSKEKSGAGPFEFLLIVLRACKGPVVVASIIGILVPIIPPLNWCAKSMAGQVLVDAFSLIGGGAIPMQLLVLGGSINSSNANPDQSLSGVEEGEVQVKKNSWLDTLKSQNFLFILSSVLIRSIVVPAVMFLVIHALNTLGIIPSDRVFLLSMLVASCAPSAINSSIICVMHDYHAREFAQMIFIMYVTAIFFSTLWLSIYIIYLN